jgi:ABC-2 type transport system ATP-binding protein
MVPIVQFDRVTKVYQGRQIGLADVSFSLPTGATIGLLGANGSGKSTVIRLALGLITPSAGEIEVFGQRMKPGACGDGKVGTIWPRRVPIGLTRSGR